MITNDISFIWGGVTGRDELHCIALALSSLSNIICLIHTRHLTAARSFQHQTEMWQRDCESQVDINNLCPFLLCISTPQTLNSLLPFTECSHFHKALGTPPHTHRFQSLLNIHCGCHYNNNEAQINKSELILTSIFNTT